jgi:hypothetical protein
VTPAAEIARAVPQHRLPTPSDVQRVTLQQTYDEALDILTELRRHDGS